MIPSIDNSNVKEIGTTAEYDNALNLYYGDNSNVKEV